MAQYLCGLDLGQAADYTALVIAEKVVPRSYDPADVHHLTVETYDLPDAPAWARRKETYSEPRLLRDGQFVDLPPDGEPRYDVRHIQRWPLGTPYPEIVRSVGEMLVHPQLGRDVTLVIDATGVGRAVVDLFFEGRRPYAVVPVMITAGSESRTDAGWHYVPKRELVGVVQVLLQSQRLRFAQALPETPLLTSELQNFQVKVTAAANETFNAREGQHDDLVLALALATWYGERVGNVRVRWF